MLILSSSLHCGSLAACVAARRQKARGAVGGTGGGRERQCGGKGNEKPPCAVHHCLSPHPAMPRLCAIVAGSVGSSGWAVRGLPEQRAETRQPNCQQRQERKGKSKGKGKAEERGNRRERTDGWLTLCSSPPLRSHSASAPFSVLRPSAWVVAAAVAVLCLLSAVAVVPFPPWVRCFRPRRCHATLSATMCADRGWRKSTSTTRCKCQSLSRLCRRSPRATHALPTAILALHANQSGCRKMLSRSIVGDVTCSAPASLLHPCLVRSFLLTDALAVSVPICVCSFAVCLPASSTFAMRLCTTRRSN
jgi:hypothetical protein